MGKYINDWFHLYETIETFQDHLNSGLISPDSICFIRDTKQIYTQNTLFGISDSEFSDLENLVNSINASQSIIEDKVDDLNQKVSNILDSTGPDASVASLAMALNSHIKDLENPHEVTKSQIGLGSVDNTSDEDKPVSRETRKLLDEKVDKVNGKELTSNDYTNSDRDKVLNTPVFRIINESELESYTPIGNDIVFLEENQRYVYWNGEKWVDHEYEIHGLSITKVDKVEGKVLSSNDFTDEYKSHIDNPWRIIE